MLSIPTDVPVAEIINGTITITCTTEGADIRYYATTDMDVSFDADFVMRSGYKYSGPFTYTPNPFETTFRIFVAAAKEGYENSDVVSFIYTQSG